MECGNDIIRSKTAPKIVTIRSTRILKDYLKERVSILFSKIICIFDLLL